MLTNIEGNNNKFWSIKLLSDGSCETHWGRVGEDGQRKVFPSYSEYQLDAKCREKEGKSFLPKTWNHTLDPRKDGYDSTFAKADASGVANNEMIVYDTQQICPRFLVEFGEVSQ